MAGSNYYVRRRWNALLGALITGAAVTPALLIHTLITGRGHESALLICGMAWLVGGLFAWREGAPLGAATAIVVALATVIPPGSSIPPAVNFLFILSSAAAVSLLSAGFIMKCGAT